MRVPHSIPAPLRSLDADALIDALFDPPPEKAGLAESPVRAPQPLPKPPSLPETVFRVR